MLFDKVYDLVRVFTSTLPRIVFGFFVNDIFTYYDGCFGVMMGVLKASE